MSHTPAPWNVEMHPVTGNFVIQARYKIHDADASCCVAVLNSAAPGRDANASLLAAAPDMLAALKVLRKRYADEVEGGSASFVDTKSIAQADAAISKAEAGHA